MAGQVWGPPWAREGATPWQGTVGRRAARVVAVLGALWLAVVALFGTQAAQHWQPHRGHLGVVGVLLVLLAPALLVLPALLPAPWRARARPAARAGAVATGAVYLSFGFPYGPVLAAPGLALGLLVLSGRQRVAWLVAVGGGVVLVSGRLIARDQQGLGQGLWLGVWTLALLGLAELGRTRMERAAEVRRAALQQRRATSEERRRRESDQRLAIARDLHDGLAHQISLINVQAGVALHLLDDGSPAASDTTRAALVAIKQASRDALGELRSALDLLRAEREGAPHAPVGLAGLGELLHQVGQAGLVVHTQGLESLPPDVPAPVEQAAFRIVQEALTNVTRHSQAASARVNLALAGRDGGRALEVEIGDGGPARGAAAVPSAGHGLEGMAERVRALGGHLEAGAQGLGWRVRAVLPLPVSEPVPAREGQP